MKNYDSRIVLVYLPVTGRFVCYHILTKIGKTISKSTVQRILNLELCTYEVNETIVKFDAEICQRLKADNRGY